MGDRNILIVEDEELMRSILRQLLESAGWRVFTADSAETALEIFAVNVIDLTLTDIKMSGKDGIELLDQIKAVDGDAMVIIMTAYSSVETAVASLRKGAYDYITKPFVNEYLLQVIRNALDHHKLFKENRVLRRELSRAYNFSEIIGTSQAMQKVFDLVNKVAGTSANILIEGESGTGKELIARAVHFNSGRGDKPFLAINCGALPETLLESELFGYTKGAFTGAATDKTGLFRAVSGGTLFLDEVGEMPPSLQVKLLRALQEHEVTPVGATSSIKFDARIIAATNKTLEIEVNEGRFREDLFYRLNVIEIDVPPLRERPEDIPMLVRHFVAKSAREQNLGDKQIDGEALKLMTTYTWPGNVRELEHVIERAVILSGEVIGRDSLPPKFDNISGRNSDENDRLLLTLDEVERRHMLKVLAKVGQDKMEAARVLGIDLSTLYRKLKRYDESDHLEVSSSTK
jgi:DNA-binding NtrC family response regulator